MSYQLRVYDELDSTQDELRRLHPCPERIAILALQQGKGYGRKGHSWQSPKGSIALSFSIPKNPSLPSTLYLPLSALALQKSLQDLGIRHCKLKWPNDVWVDNRKIAGFIGEMSQDNNLIFIGMGLNYQNKIKDYANELQNKITTVSEYQSHSPTPSEFCKTYLENVLHHMHLAQINPEFIVKNLQEQTLWLGQTVEALLDEKTQVYGQFQAIGSQGEALIQESTGKITALFSGDLSLRLK